jgi:hypothetical protein
MVSVEMKTVLRSSLQTINKVDIIARNPKADVLTFIAKREGGQATFGNPDARKIINSINEVPEIYTLKPYKSGWIAVAANIINNDELVIPLCIATTYSGDITLTFKGMDAYDAYLTLIDTETNHKVDLTGLASFDYVFNYTPKIINGAPAVCEDRFSISISNSPTGQQAPVAEKVNVFGANGLIQITSGASNPIKEVAVYNLQGVLIYKPVAINAITHLCQPKSLKGFYIVRVVTEKNIDNFKVIIR